MSNNQSSGGPALNTDREIWRERPDDYYADSIHVTSSGRIAIDCGGYVITRPIREWHQLAERVDELEIQLEAVEAALEEGHSSED